MSDLSQAISLPHSQAVGQLEPEALVPAGLLARARAYALASKAPRTVAGYRSDWTRFETWCRTYGLCALPAAPASVALYLTACAEEGRKVSTIARSLAAVSEAHRLAGYTSPRTSPAVRAVFRGIRRQKGSQNEQKSALSVAELRAMVRALPGCLRGLRDRAVLLLGFAGAFRRSELVGLDVADLEFVSHGVAVRISRSKTDQEGAGLVKGIPRGTNDETCPVAALTAWLDAAGIREGAVFRPVDRHGRVGTKRLSDRAVARIVQRAARAIGLDPGRYAGHSLRAGLATAAARAAVPERVIAEQTGHRSVAMVRRYVRPAELFSENAAAAVGL